MRIIVALFISIVIISACSSLKLSPAEFTWPIESALKINNDGVAKEDHYSFSFNTKSLFMEEMQDSMAYVGKELRIIRNQDGYYFITSKGFKNIYIFEASEGSFSLKNKITISETGLNNPVFNQRSPYIELVDGNFKAYFTSEGLRGGVE